MQVIVESTASRSPAAPRDSSLRYALVRVIVLPRAGLDARLQSVEIDFRTAIFAVAASIAAALLAGVIPAVE